MTIFNSWVYRTLGILMIISSMVAYKFNVQDVAPLAVSTPFFFGWFFIITGNNIIKYLSEEKNRKNGGDNK